ncbi:MAG: DEAD/DEAH box helicase [Promethearchaeota archaeon]
MVNELEGRLHVPGLKIIDVDDVQGHVNTKIESNVKDVRISSILKKRGLLDLRRVQALAIHNGLFFRKSMLICTPSGSGKTLIGELAAVVSVIEGYGKSVFLVPFKALATEKYKQFVRYWSTLGIKIEISIGDYDMPIDDLMKADIIIMTYEKMDSMMRSLGTELENIFGTIVIDEIHIMGEPHRGPRLESLIMRIASKLDDIQVIGLSATIANPREFASWLSSLGFNLLLLLSKSRPIPLNYKLTISRNDLHLIRDIVKDAWHDGGQCLIFTRSRKKAETLARHLSAVINIQPDDETYHQRVQLAFKIKRNQKYSELPAMIIRGVAFHHAGLSVIEREVVEHAFKNHVIHVIFCTTTLSAGINLPARFVILQDYKQFQTMKQNVMDMTRFHDGINNKKLVFKPIPRNTFHQILGRAGRPGYDLEGNAHVLVRSRQEIAWCYSYYFKKDPEPKTEEHVLEEEYFHAQPAYDPLRSHLSDRDVMLEQLLINISDFKSITHEELKDFFVKSFFNFNRTNNSESLESLLKINRITTREIIGDVSRGNGSTFNKLEINEVLIHDFDEERVTGEVRLKNGDIHECQLTIKGGLHCSCFDRPGIHARKICDHFKVFLSHAIKLFPEKEARINEMLVMALRSESHVDYLVDNNLIERVRGNAYRCTAFGSLVIKLYIYPTMAVAIRRGLIESLSLMNGDKFMFDSWIFHFIRKLLKEFNQGQDDLIYHSTWHWINEEPMEIIINPTEKPVKELEDLKTDAGSIYPGDFSGFLREFSRWARIIGKIALFLNINYIHSRCLIMETRLKHGIKDELISLVSSLRGVGRIRGRILFNSGYKNIEAIANSTARDLHSTTGLPVKTCERIINAARLNGELETSSLDDFEEIF